MFHARSALLCLPARCNSAIDEIPRALGAFNLTPAHAVRLHQPVPQHTRIHPPPRAGRQAGPTRAVLVICMYKPNNPLNEHAFIPPSRPPARPHVLDCASSCTSTLLHSPFHLPPHARASNAYYILNTIHACAPRTRPNLVNAAKTAMSSKILGPESSFFAEMAVDAVTAVRMESGGDMGKKASTFAASPVYCSTR